MRRSLLFALLALALLVAACRQEGLGDGVATPGTPETPQTLTPTPATAPEATPQLPADTVATAGRAITLTLWTNPEIPALGDRASDVRLFEQIRAFDADHPAIAVEISVKSLSGQGSILNYLRVGRSVAPTVMPDLILIPSSQLAQAAADQLIYPLDAMMPPEVTEDLFPAALALAQHDERLFAYPFAARRLLHLAYSEAAVTEPLPAVWDDFVDRDDIDLILPAAGPEIGRLTLGLYLSDGGTLVNEANRPQLEVETLTGALSRLRAGRQSGLISLRSSNVPDLSQAWQIFQSGEATATLVAAVDFRGYRAEGQFAGYAAVPGIDGSLPPLIETWLWAVSTADPTRQQAAVELISWLATPERISAWTLDSGSLPARASGFDPWPTDDYVTFLQDELGGARPFPPTASATYMEALEDAAFNVISLQMTAAEAAAEAAAAVQP